MARYTGPKNKKNRRFGLPLKNGKPDTKRTGTGRGRRLSDYGLQLREKQNNLQKFKTNKVIFWSQQNIKIQ